MHVSIRGNKESELVETMVRKYLYKSHGKFRLAMIDIEDKALISDRILSVGALILIFPCRHQKYHRSI